MIKLAMICKNGCRECDGCMMCYPDEVVYVCTICGKECDEVYFDKYGEIFACDNCVRKKEWWEMNDD